MLTSPTRNDQRTLKYVCLRRDNHRCVLSGIWNHSTVRMLPDYDSRKPRGRTVLAHIIPFCLEELAKKWVTIQAMFPEVGSFVSDNVNEPCNAMTMLSSLHDAFGAFHFSLCPTVRY